LALCMLLSVFSALPIAASAASSGQCDNDFDTMNDRNIIVIADGAETNITDNDTLNSNPVFADNRIYYYSARNIVSANIDGSDKQNIFKEEKQGLTDNFVVDTNSNGGRRGG